MVGLSYICPFFPILSKKYPVKKAAFLFSMVKPTYWYTHL
ncbi:hypothetical protein HMPREF9130_0963 [Peptoniphilus sp. oral taxon 375 str. F0436]|nr:hypothetical protein HMPREF9130_0963 [Peptoniphilus sp. oral taxon 375 str. F0436]